MKLSSVFVGALLFLGIIISGCSTPLTMTKSYTEEIGPDGKKTIIKSESVVQVKQNVTKEINLEYIK
ncbi:MAG: hypothetical protein H6680_00405 [Desulfobacteraceae bacterium]|nr:hypothetical protein [Desulfobacteraceae bacterium]